MQKIALQPSAHTVPRQTSFTTLTPAAEEQNMAIHPMTSKVQRRSFSLIEVLMVLALLAMLMTMFMDFLQQGGSQVRAEAEQTEMHRQVAMLKNSFRNFVHLNGAVYSCSDKTVVFKNDNLLSIESKRLIFKQGEHTNSLQLPKKCIVTFKLEHHDKEADLLVLTITKKPNPKLPGRQKYFIRLVASCLMVKPEIKHHEVTKK